MLPGRTFSPSSSHRSAQPQATPSDLHNYWLCSNPQFPGQPARDNLVSDSSISAAAEIMADPPPPPQNIADLVSKQQADHDGRVKALDDLANDLSTTPTSAAPTARWTTRNWTSLSRNSRTHCRWSSSRRTTLCSSSSEHRNWLSS
jgi:hypothetical protein